MGTVIYFLLCSFVVVLAQDEVEFETDMPFLRVKVYNKTDLVCCYRHKSNIDPNLKPSWHKKSNMTASLEPVTNTGFVTQDTKTEPDRSCGILNFKLVKMEDNGLYQCMLNSSTIQRLSHGTYLQVYQPLEKTINIGENTKNKILTAEGILLFLCVILPAAALLCQSKKLNELERKKMKKEEENIYQGLNLDDCCSTYDQIERSQAHGPYQDVCNIMEEEEEIQLEKP